MLSEQKSDTVRPDLMITTEDELRAYYSDLRNRNVREISLDLEGDQGSFRYKYSISIFQCFDGEKSAVIDVLKMGNNGTLRELLTDETITKVMFSCPNDIFMTQNVLGCTISPVRDIAVGQKLLGLPINLSNYLDIDREKKDSFQRANWLTRPIRPELLEYAINDVLKLLSIEQKIARELREKELYEEYVDATRSVSGKDFRVNQHKLYMAKFPGYSRMRPEKKILAARVWIFRELLGQKLNCPVGYVLSKKRMARIIDQTRESVVKELESELNSTRRQSKKICMETIRMLFEKASRSPHLPRPKPVRSKRKALRDQNRSVMPQTETHNVTSSEKAPSEECHRSDRAASAP
ncbi:MAG: hypothetical protein ACLFVQ_05790 [Chitinispirillaceae bacterium]